jgi:tetratricopeptide (TPR) repeat protein
MSWSREPRTPRVSAAQEADVQIAFGRVAESQGNIDGAEAAYRAALRRDKSRADAYLHLANTLTLKGEYRQARDQYQKAIQASPGNADIFCDMGYSDYLQHKWDDAQRNLKQAIAIQPDHRRAHNNLAVVLAHLGKTQESLAEFRKAGNSVAGSHANLAFSLSLEKNWTAAREEFRLATAAKPESETIRSRLREVDVLIASHGSPGVKKNASLDTQTVPASTRRAAAIPPQRPISPAAKTRQPTPATPVQCPQRPTGDPVH